MTAVLPEDSEETTVTGKTNSILASDNKYRQ